MAVPKRKMSKSRKRLRRGHHAAASMRTQACPRCSSPKLSHRVCPSCGDDAPRAEIEGAVRALATVPGEFRVQLVGQTAAIERELAKHPEADRSRIDIVDAPDVIGMAEKPLAAVRRKPNSSVVVGLGLQKQGRSDAFVSAGNTGATLAASTVLLGLHDGVERATVATLFPTGREPVLVLDGGANLDCSARELVGFAYLGTVYMRDIVGQSTPVVGLLNIGEEEE